MGEPSLTDQVRFWDEWNKHKGTSGAPSRLTARKCASVLGFLEGLRLANPAILEVGCGTGWMAERLSRHGTVTALDLAEEAVLDARSRYPGIEFMAGDILTLELSERRFEVIVTMETVSHVSDQPAFFAKLASLLKPGGHLIVTCQNRFVFQRRNEVMAQGAGQIRHWLTMAELKRLMRPRFRIRKTATVGPAGERGILRWVNSTRLAGLLEWAITEAGAERLKERLGFGQTLVVLGRLRG